MNDNLLEYESGPEQLQAPKRPQFLTVLCVLSFIWSALVLLMLLICLLSSGFIFSTLQSIVDGTLQYPGIQAEQQAAIEYLLSLGQKTFSVIIAVAMIWFLTSLLGVIKMWKLQKWGFYIYAAINGLGVIYSIYSGSYLDIVISAGFIGMYFANLKYMK